MSVRREGNRTSPEVARFIELEDVAKAAGKGKWGANPQVFKKLVPLLNILKVVEELNSDINLYFL